MHLAAPSCVFSAATRCSSCRSRQLLRVSASDDDDAGLLPPPVIKSFSKKAERRIARSGPRETDLRDEVGRIPKECLPRALWLRSRGRRRELTSFCSAA